MKLYTISFPGRQFKLPKKINPSLIHCATCATAFKISNPQGVIAFNSNENSLLPGEDCIFYHLTSDRKVTTCGIIAKHFDSYIGTIGIELSDNDLVHEWLRELTACSECFAFVW